MAEQSKKTYITAREFVEAWEKEVYELNHLDYFIFLLINELASNIEYQYLTALKTNHPLYLYSEDVGALSFNIGDSLQLFLEKNCFGSCPLKCPSRLNENLDREEAQLRIGILSQFISSPDQCATKDECLYADLFSYVVLDSLIDFYNYEMNIIFNESDKRLLKFAEFVMDIIMQFFRSKGPELLKEPTEVASNQFVKWLDSEENLLTDLMEQKEEDNEYVEGDEWKYSHSSVHEVLERFSSDFRSDSTDHSAEALINKFGEFLTDFLAIKKIDELHIEDIEEFFTVVLPNEMMLKEQYDLENVRVLFVRLVDYLEFNDLTDIREEYQKFANTTVPHLERTLRISVEYQKSHPLIQYLLNKDEQQNETVMEGFFEIKKIANNKAFLEDIHLKARYKSVDISKLSVERLYRGDIIHGEIAPYHDVWTLSHIEMVYPAKAKFYLY